MRITINSLGLLKSRAGLHGESPSSLRNEDFNDTLGNEVSISRTQAVDRDMYLQARSFGSLAGCLNGSEICSPFGPLCKLYSTARHVTLFKLEVSP